MNGEIDLNGVSKWVEDRIMNEFVKIKGIGRWTAEYVMTRGMHKYASTPIDDLFLRRGYISLLFQWRENL